jgi:TonB family protein
MKKLIALPIITGLVIFISCKQQQDAVPKPGITDISVDKLEAIAPDNIKSIDMNDNIAILTTKDRKKYRTNLEGTKFDFKKLPQEESKSNSEVFTIVEEPPTFPGGEQALALYLNRNIRYPKEAQEKNISGTLIVQFIVEADGTVKDAKIVGKRYGGGLEEESLRVINAMPKWVAGKQNGRKVAVQFNLPIRFNLATDNKLSMLEPFLLFKKGKDC